jgi:undecaprenyl-diphosphatase
MSVFHAIILGIVEGLTEFLPVSSTGHLILASELFRIPETEFLKSFEVIIQLGAILAVVVLYWKKLFLEWEVMKRIAVAIVPALGVGYLFYSSIRRMLGSETVVLWSLLIGGIIIILIEYFRKEKEGVVGEVANMSYKTAFFVGLFQAVSVIPGVSRAGATIMGGLLLGVKRTVIVEFSFLLAVPTMVAATGYDLLKNGAAFSSDDLGLLVVGLITSFVVAIVAIRFFLRFVSTHTFIAFGVYRIFVAIIFSLFVLR